MNGGVAASYGRWMLCDGLHNQLMWGVIFTACVVFSSSL